VKDVKRRPGSAESSLLAAETSGAQDDGTGTHDVVRAPINIDATRAEADPANAAAAGAANFTGPGNLNAMAGAARTMAAIENRGPILTTRSASTPTTASANATGIA
jgi:hypothetical protein